MSVEENKAMLKALFEKQGMTDEERREMHTPDFVHHWHEGTKTIDEVLAARADRRQSRGPGRVIIDDMIAEGDRVAMWFTAKREGQPDHRYCFIYRISGGKIAETWNMISLQSQAFGGFPPPKE